MKNILAVRSSASAAINAGRASGRVTALGAARAGEHLRPSVWSMPRTRRRIRPLIPFSRLDDEPDPPAA